MGNRHSRIACLLVPSPALAAELAARPQLHGRPVAVSDDSGRRVAEATEAAAARGVRPGQRLSEALACCPVLAVLEARPARVRHAASMIQVPSSCLLAAK